MADPDIPAASRIRPGGVATFGLQRLIGLAIGGAGGALASVLLATPFLYGILYGALFGLAFGLFFSRRVTTPGAGFIWGVAAALLLWIVGPAVVSFMIKGANTLCVLVASQTRNPPLAPLPISARLPALSPPP